MHHSINVECQNWGPLICTRLVTLYNPLGRHFCAALTSSPSDSSRFDTRRKVWWNKKYLICLKSIHLDKMQTLKCLVGFLLSFDRSFSFHPPTAANTLPAFSYWIPYFRYLSSYHGKMGRRFPDGGLLRYRKRVPQQLGDVADRQPTNGSTAQRHGSQSHRLIIFAVRVWSAVVYLLSRRGQTCEI